ncbi:putative peptidoglycan binding protein [Motilibacter peucedani]|uniref:Putative peptidoglycan binding protein n=1 Tax=Motilibacter peucedani TaxID=598650 RepID=A0A420XK95_9ACTN|nr:NlpC/P60 family protein [Motilibacter peucedani]RKS68561.1 putative peptidoglycan binding protein [Motilibacter peucedani]
MSSAVVVRPLALGTPSDHLIEVVPAPVLPSRTPAEPRGRRRAGAHRRPSTAGRTAARAAVVPAVAAALAAPVVGAGAAHAAPGSHSSARLVHATTTGARSAVAAHTSLLKASPSVTRVVTSHPSLDGKARGGAVRFVQRRLGVKPTGKFGTATSRAVARLQRAAGLQVTGVVDSATWRALGVGSHSTSPVRTRTAAKSTTAKSTTAKSSAKSSDRVVAKADSGRSVRLENGPGSLAFGKLVLAAARHNAGGPYRYGGTSPRGFDCSGYVSYVFRQLGVSLPHSSGAIRGEVKKISRSQVRPGDLVFVSKHGRTSHVAIYAGGGYWYEASHPGKPVGKNKAWTSSVSYGRVA